MYKIKTTHQFEKDLKRCIKRCYPMDKFREVIRLLERDGKLPAEYRPHVLHGIVESLQIECMGNLGYGAFATHPGEVLKDEIVERGISQRQLADSMGLTYSVVNEILNGRRPLTAKTALMFEAALDVPADSLMYLQTKYNMQTARKDSSPFEMLKEIRKIAAVF